MTGSFLRGDIEIEFYPAVKISLHKHCFGYKFYPFKSKLSGLGKHILSHIHICMNILIINNERQHILNECTAQYTAQR